MPRKSVLKYFGLVAELGLTIVICIGGGMLAGIWLDNKLGTEAPFTVVLLLAGIGAAFMNIYRLVMPRKKE